MSVVEEVKQKLDIVEVIGRYTQLQKAGRNFKAVCPFHTEKTPSFFVFPERQSWHCFGACNTGGDVFSFVMKKEGVEFGEALRMLADQAGVLMPTRIEPGPGRDEKERIYQANELAARFFHEHLKTPSGEKVMTYLTERGVNQESITSFELGYSPNAWELLKLHLLERGFSEKEMISAGLIIQSDDGKTHDRFRHRLMFPIHDVKGRVTGFGGRALDDSQHGKYINSPQTPVFDKSSTLYGFHLAAPAIRNEDMAIITEGYMDVIMPHQYGFKNVTASMGVAITEKHVNQLKRLTKNLVLALDPDEAGEEAMLRCIDYENLIGSEVRVVILPEGKDPDEIMLEDPQIWRDSISGAKPVIEFAIEKTVGKFNMNNAGEKSLAVNSLLPIIAKVKDDIRRDHYLTRLSKLTKIEYNRLESVLKKYVFKPKLKTGKPVIPAIKMAAPPNAREEYCLKLIIHHPELKNIETGLIPEYFGDSQNREIYMAWQEVDDVVALRSRLDGLLQEKLDDIVNKPPPGNKVNERFKDCILLLEKDFLQNREAMRREVFAMEAETGGAGADLVRLLQEGDEPIQKAGRLKEVFNRKAQSSRKANR